MWLIIIHINNIYFNLQEIDILIRSIIVCGDISCYISEYYYAKFILHIRQN